MKKNYDMQQKFDKKKGRVSKTNYGSQDLIHQHMSNHYRRILNAKKTVDTSPPSCYKARKSTSSVQKTLSETKTSSNNQEAPQKNISLVLTDRSNSSNSCKGSYWGSESILCSSRYHAACIPENIPSAPLKCTLVGMDLINQITYDTKNGPMAYCDEGWQEIKAQQKNNYFVQGYDPPKDTLPSNSTAASKRRLPNKLNELKQKRKFPIKDKLSPPASSSKSSRSNQKNTKPEVISKLRGLRVYYPPRKKLLVGRTDCDVPDNIQLDSQLERLMSTPNYDVCNCCNIEEDPNSKNPVTDTPKDIQTSSRDSAYNGGTSSAPQSRTPTPDQTNNKDFIAESDNVCSCKKDVLKLEKSTSTSTTKEPELEKSEVKMLPRSLLLPEPEPQNEEKMIEEKIMEQQILDQKMLEQKMLEQKILEQKMMAEKMMEEKTKEEQEAIKEIKEEAKYIKFVQDITNEILEKNLYTNKALKKVMKSHILKNINDLDKDRMLEEIENLRIQIGIPEDKELFNITNDSPTLRDTSLDLLDTIITISDSEFVQAKNTFSLDENSEPRKPSTKKSVQTSVTREFPTSISQVIDSDPSNLDLMFDSESLDDEDLISVIEITKALREKRKEIIGRKFILGKEKNTITECKNKVKSPIHKKEIMKKEIDSSSLSSSEAEERHEEEDEEGEEEDEEEEDERAKYKASSSKENSLSRKGKKKIPAFDRKPRLVSFRNNQEKNESNYFELKIREMVKAKKKTNG